MLKSMTGFGARQGRVALLGKVAVELRSSNHKFLEIVFHLPEGFLSLEEKIRREIEAEIKRGRVTCAVRLLAGPATEVLVNKNLLKNYLAQLGRVKKEFRLRDEVSLQMLMHLPGVFALNESHGYPNGSWPGLKSLIQAALEKLTQARQKEGRALAVYLKKQALTLQKELKTVRAKFHQAIRHRLARIKTEEEQSAFLKDADITEELDRLAFHTRSFFSKIRRHSPVGKELDFIAQEMQREANTMAAKSFDARISGRVVQMKSQVEKIREQVQNIE